MGASASSEPRLGVKDAFSICLAMVDGDRSLHHAAAGMWHALAPFVPGLTQAEAEVALAALAALGEADALTDLRELRRRAARHGLNEAVAVLDDWLAHTGARLAP